MLTQVCDITNISLVYVKKANEQLHSIGLEL